MRGAAVAVAAVACAGCYQRTVSSKGPGSVNETIEEPYQEHYLIDDLIFGPEEKKK